MIIKPPDYKFCPFCGKILKSKLEEGRVQRKFCPKDKWAYYPSSSPSVCAIIVKDRKALMVKRNRNPFKDTWMFPAGFLDFAETPQHALVREVEEEVGLKVLNYAFIDVVQTLDDPRNPGHLTFMYKVSVEGYLKNNDEDENSEIAWLPINEPLEIGWEKHREMMEKLRAGKI